MSAVIERDDLLLTPEEIKRVSGYTQQSKQIEELKRRGFWRVRRGAVTGEVILERAHYEAVCMGIEAAQAAARKRAAGPEKRVRDF
jgi:hypothetical protein